MESWNEWISKHKHITALIASAVLVVFGILSIIGAIKNWDWLYKPDNAYHNKWTMGQISRYLGRDVARVAGSIGGVVLIIAGGYWLYYLLAKK